MTTNQVVVLLLNTIAIVASANAITVAILVLRKTRRRSR